MMKNSAFDSCLEKDKIKPFSRGVALTEKELELASFDLERGKKNLAETDYKWATIQAYYAMFHAGRALLYVKNYREKSHHCLIIALEEFYKDNAALQNLLKEMWVAKRLREDADYYGNYSEEGADKLLKAAGELIDLTKEIIK